MGERANELGSLRVVNIELASLGDLEAGQVETPACGIVRLHTESPNSLAAFHGPIAAVVRVPFNGVLDPKSPRSILELGCACVLCCECLKVQGCEVLELDVNRNVFLPMERASTL